MSEALALLLKLALVVGIFLTVVTIGLSATWGEATALFKQPGQLARSLLAMNVLAPVVACLMALAFGLHPAVRIALVAMAVSPVPPFLPKFSAGGPYGIGLLAVTSMLAVVFVPVMLVLLQHVFGVRLTISPMDIAALLGVTVLVPLVLGLGVRAAAPSLAQRLMKPATRVAIALLLCDTVVVLVEAGPDMWRLVGDGTLLAMLSYSVVVLAIGHVLGGPMRRDRTTLGLCTVSRHPGVALAVATANFPNQLLVLPAVLLLTAVGSVATWPYVRWMSKEG